MKTIPKWMLEKSGAIMKGTGAVRYLVYTFFQLETGSNNNNGF